MDACEAALGPDVDVIPVANLAQLVNHHFGAEPIAPVTVTPDLGSVGVFVPTDFREVKGQEHVSAIGLSIGDSASASGGAAGDTARHLKRRFARRGQLGERDHIQHLGSKSASDG